MFVIDGEELNELEESEFGTEDDFQTLLEKHPELLSGKLIDSESPRKWLLITREAGIPDRQEGSNIWSVDHLFLDQDGIPTLVEVKRSTDTRIRREVVGQMLDYAANSVAYWSVDTIKNEYEYYCEKRELNPENELSEFLDFQSDASTFWDKVDTNLKAGKIRMLFVADKLPKELIRIIEFLNNQLNPAEVLGVELNYFSNGRIETLVPRVLGKTSASEIRKSNRTTRKWTKEDFLIELENQKSKKERQIIEKLISELESRNLRLWYGEGSRSGSIIPVFDGAENLYQLYAIYTYGKIEIYFQWHLKKEPFSKKEKRLELLNKLNSLGLNLPESKINQRPSFDISSLADEAVFSGFVDIFDWFIEEVKKVQ